MIKGKQNFVIFHDFIKLLFSFFMFFNIFFIFKFRVRYLSRKHEECTDYRPQKSLALHVGIHNDTPWLSRRGEAPRHDEVGGI